MSTPDPSVTEVMSQCGYDFLLFDGEHAPLPTQTLRYLLPITERRGAPAMYRPASHASPDIKAALDMGVDALLVPMVETVEQAKVLVDIAKYAPLGRRGIGPLRASNYYKEFDVYLATANTTTSLVVQIESQIAVDAAADIVAVDGIDGLYVGPADLASDIGLPIGELNDEFLVLLEQVAAAAAAMDKPCGIDLANVADIPKLRALGFTFFTHGQDTLLMMEAARATVQILRAS